MTRTAMRGAPSSRDAAWRRYGAAVLFCAIAVIPTALWIVHYNGNHAIAALLAAILMTGWYAGAGPALLGLLLCIAIDRVIPIAVGRPGEWSLTLRDVWFTTFAAGAAYFGAERRRAAAALWRANERLDDEVKARTAELQYKSDLLLESERLAQTGSWAIPRRAGRPYHWSEGMERITGISGNDGTLSDARLRSVVHADDRPSVERIVEEAMRAGRAFAMEHRIVRADDTVRDVRVIGHPRADPADPFSYVGFTMDVTEQRSAERAARLSRDRAVRARFDARLAERARIAQEMHDTLLQGFTGLSLELLAITNRIHAPADEVQALRRLLHLAERTLADARNAISDIRVAVPADLLVDVLRDEVKGILSSSGVALDFVVEGTPCRIDDAVAGVIVRVAREAVHNVVRHAGAQRLVVRLIYRPRAVRLCITDDGRGMRRRTESQSYGGHWGLLGMQERASMIGGKLWVDSREGAGTTVWLRAPSAAAHGSTGE
jgi:PAS domain S-box-containing protein